MTIGKKEFSKFEDIFPHMENILHCGIYSYNTNPEESYWSEGVYRIFGVEPFSIPCEPGNLIKFIVPEDRERVASLTAESRKTRKPYKLEFSIIDAQGKFKRLYAENSFNRQDIDPGSYEGILKDITETHAYRMALEEKIQQLDKSNQSLQEFVYIASHDLQEPLRKISTFVGRLKSRFESALGEEGEMYVGRILNSTQNMQTLLEDLLSFSRLSFSDKEFSEVDLSECLRSVIADLEVKIEETGAKIITPPSLPVIEGYAVQLKQLLQNLIGNALKFHRPGQTPRIEVKAEEIMGDPLRDPALKNTTYVKLSVADNGIGFEQEFSEKIFKIFQRLNGKSEYPGSGVGLSICKRITDNHHGTITAEGKLDQGAVFTVMLPIKQNT